MGPSLALGWDGRGESCDAVAAVCRMPALQGPEADSFGRGQRGQRCAVLDVATQHLPAGGRCVLTCGGTLGVRRFSASSHDYTVFGDACRRRGEVPPGSRRRAR